MPFIEGIDTSVYQGNVDWKAVKQSGRQFAIIKATEGNYGKDKEFARSWAQAKQYGLIRIAYHFLRSNIDGAQQAAYHHAYVRSQGRFSIGDGCMIDHETMDGASPALALANAELFATEMMDETQCGMLYYSGFYFWHDALGNPSSSILAKCPLVEASYGAKPITIQNWPNGLTIWQYSDNGIVPGVPVAVDLDRAYTDAKTLARLCVVGGRE